MKDPYQILGVSETATDEEIKKAYRDLARKYHPDNYQDNPLADLAQERMKEINAAYEEITKARSGRSGSGSGGPSYGSSYNPSGGGYQQQQYYGQSGASVFQQIRLAIQTGNLARAEALLSNYGNHNAEWHYLKGAVCYRRGWMDEARRYYETACQMDPENLEYRRALNYMDSGTRNAYQPSGSPFGTELCGGNDLCMRMCCYYMICNSCGFRICFI